jgi:hypothetical protein
MRMFTLKLAPISFIAACSLLYQISLFPPTPPKSSWFLVNSHWSLGLRAWEFGVEKRLNVTGCKFLVADGVGCEACSLLFV